MSTPNPAPDLPNLESKVDFHPQGDVILVVGKHSGNREFRVSSHILCLASPVFLAMLGPGSGFKESRALKAGQATGSPVEVPLPDDDPAPWNTILAAIHNCFDLVPQELTEGQLYDIAVLCDKYNIRRAISVWVKYVWVPPHDPKPLFSFARVDNRWMYIAYVFALKDTFKLITHDFIVKHVSCLRDFEWGEEGNRYPFTHHLPGTVLRAMESVRFETNRRMLECAHDLLSDYLCNEGEAKCKSGAVQSCDDAILGGLIRALKRVGLYPLPDPTAKPPKIGLARLRVYFATLDIYYYTTVGSACKSCTWQKGIHYCGKVTNHEWTCSPMPAFVKKIIEIYDSAHGLDYDKVM